MMQYGGMGGLGVISYILGLLITLGVLALVVLSILALIRYLNPQSKTGGNSAINLQSFGNSALNILNERLAKGEIGSDEYEKIKAQLQK